MGPLETVAELELIDRERRMVERRIKAARFPVVKRLDCFDFKVIPSLNKALVLELARCEYIERRENLIALGNSGTGKIHIALGLGLAACQKGLSVGFITAAALVHELIEARDDKQLLRFQKKLATYKLLIVERTRLRAAVEDRRRAVVRGVQPTLRAGLDPGPGANPVALRLRPGDDDRRQRRFLVCRQPPRRVALWTVVKPLQSLCIVTNNRVAKRLAIHPRKPRGISPGHLLQSIRDPIGPRRRSTVRFHASPAPKLQRRQIIPYLEC